MSYLLDAVAEAREHEHASRDEYVRAVVRAREQHTLREIARAAGVNHNAIVGILRREKERGTQ